MKEQVIERFNELIEANQPDTEISRLFNIAIQNGSVVDENQSDYENAKILVFAILSAMADKWKPMLGNNVKTALKLKRTLH